MPFERELPGGRQSKRGPDAMPVQNEAFESRAGRVPAFGGLIVSTRGEFGQHSGSSTTLIANRLYLAPLWSASEKVVTLTEARVKMDVIAAATYALAAIYRLTADGKKKFSRVAGSSVRFETITATGVKTAACSVELAPNETYYVGLICSSATPAFFCPSTGTSPATYSPMRYADVGATLLYESIQLASTARETTLPVPEVSFYTQEGVALL